MKLSFYLITMSTLLTLLFSNCTSSEEKISSIENDLIRQKNNNRAIELLKSKCYACHSSKVTHENLLAPPMIAIKMRYTKATSNEQEFVDQLVNFVENPSRDKALLKHAVKEYGLMPKEGTQKEDLEIIARYLYTAEIEQPEWWDNRHDKHHSKKNAEEPKEIGLNYALTTKKALGKQLMQAIEKGGPSYAVEFCNTKAIPITDSVSKLFNAKINRVSDKPRNPDNKANENELAVIRYYKSELAENKELKPITEVTSEGTQFFYPIKTNSMCLKCHGSPEKEINKATLTALNELYPADKAKGYGENEIRGIWSILFKTEEK